MQFIFYNYYNAFRIINIASRLVGNVQFHQSAQSLVSLDPPLFLTNVLIGMVFILLNWPMLCKQNCMLTKQMTRQAWGRYDVAKSIRLVYFSFNLQCNLLLQDIYKLLREVVNMQFLVQLVSQWHCIASCWKNSLG